MIKISCMAECVKCDAYTKYNDGLGLSCYKKGEFRSCSKGRNKDI